MTLIEYLDALYQKHDDPSLVPPDPLQFVHRYADPADQEIVGLVASALAFGRAELISRR